MTICQRIEWAGPGLSRSLPARAGAAFCRDLRGILCFVAAAALLFPLSLEAADSESTPTLTPTPDVVSTPVSGRADTRSTPSFHLDFDTLLKSEEALQPLTGLNSEESRRTEPEFLLRLGERTLSELKGQKLDELGLYLLADPLLVPDSESGERQRRRWHLLERQGQLDPLQKEIADAFEKAQGALRVELGLRLGDILLRANKSHEARTVFETLAEEVAEGTGIHQQILERIVRADFHEGRYAEALRAARAVDIQYSPDQPSWRQLLGLVLLASGQSAEAATVLSELSSVEARLWEVYARWQGKALSSGTALIAIGEIKIPADNRRVAALRSAMIAKMADAPEFLDTRGLALEALAQSAVELPPLVQIDVPPRLIDAYSVLAEPQIGGAELLLDNPEQMTAYLNRSGSQSDVRRRALAVSLLRLARDRTSSDAITLWLLHHLIEQGLNRLITLFFIDGTLGVDLEQLHPEAIMLLVDETLRGNDLPLAARLQSLMDEPPVGVDHGAWTVRSARILILGGEAVRGARQLGEWLSGIQQITPDSLDRIMQIMFDLQFIGEHGLALELFEIAAPLTQSEGHRRELFFWSAQSFYEVGDFALSAAYYLESARLAGEHNPFWQKSALYQAAQALESALFYDDAAKVYKRLLGSSPDPKMQAKLRYRLAQIEQHRKRDLSP